MRTVSWIAGFIGAAAASLAVVSVSGAGAAPVPTATVVPGPQQVGAAAGCPITRFGHTGRYLCGTTFKDMVWSDGHRETFVIGTNHQIYSITAQTNGWRSLGGYGKTKVTASYDRGHRPAVLTVGSDGHTWCRVYTGKPWWNAWHRCAQRGDVTARANTWLTANHGRPVPYSQTKYFQGWRTDCSGYVSMALNTRNAKNQKVNYNTASLVRSKVVTAISFSSLKRGDLIGFLGPGSEGNAGHVMIFDKWANSKHTAYWVYEESGGANKTVHRTHPRSYNNGHTFKAYRYNDIID